MWPNPQETAESVTFTDVVLNGKYNLLRLAYSAFQRLRFCLPPPTGMKESY